MEPRTKPLSEHLAGIVSMLLGVLRAYGWRALFVLPELFRAQRMIRALFAELIALAKAFEAGTLPPIPPAPEPAGTEPEDCYEAPAQSPAPARPAARVRQRPAARPTAPAAEAAPDRPRAAICAPPPPPPPRRVPQPYSVLRLPAGILVTARSR